MELAMQQEKAKQLRADIIKMLYLCQSGHPGGSLSLVEMLMAIYYNTAHVDPKNPKWEDRDRIVLSKGLANIRHRGCLLADSDVNADHAFAALVDDGVDRDSGLTSLAVADD